MARRNVLHGASAWEREERANQQRDYAAQLQQQVQQKQAKQEQERALRQQEQHEELDILERERATATRKHQPQYEEVAPPDPPIPAHSTHRAVSLPHMPMTNQQMQGAHVLSPLKATTTDSSLSHVETNSWPIVAQSEHHDPAPMVAATGGVSEFHAPSFATAPSIFESLVREPGIGARSIAFYDDLAALQRLSAEFESATESRRSKTQSNYVKPNFVHQQDTPLSTTFTAWSPVQARTDQCTQVKDDGKLIEDEHAVPRLELHSSLDGLLGESVLLPLNTKRQRHPSHDRLTTQAVQSSGSPLQRFTTTAMTTKDVEDETSLDNHSEMLHFTPTAS